MELEKKQDRRRLGTAAGAAILFHLLLFSILHLLGFLKVPGEQPFLGPVQITISGTAFPDTAPQAGENIKGLDDLEDSSNKKKVEQNLEDSAVGGEGNSPKSLTSETPAAGKVDAGSGSPAAGSTGGQKASAPIVQEISTYSDAAISGSYSITMGSRFDKAEPVFHIPFDLPPWADAQKLKFDITFSFIVGAGGYIEEINIDKSSGFTDVDNSIITSFRNWLFSKPVSADRIVGKFTYRSKYD